MKKSAIVAAVGAALTVVGIGAAGVAEAADSAPACPTAYQCLQNGTDPQVPYGTDPSVPYGVGQWNNQVPFGSGSSSYTAGAY